VLSLPPTVRIWLATAPTDMRLGFDGLAARVRQGLLADPLSGQFVVFIGRRADRLKILYWDTSGYALWSKRLERGTFHLPTPGADAVVRLTPAALAMLLEGIDPAGARRRKRLIVMNANT